MSTLPPRTLRHLRTKSSSQRPPQTRFQRTRKLSERIGRSLITKQPVLPIPYPTWARPSPLYGTQTRKSQPQHNRQYLAVLTAPNPAQYAQVCRGEGPPRFTLSVSSCLARRRALLAQVGCESVDRIRRKQQKSPPHGGLFCLDSPRVRSPLWVLAQICPVRCGLNSVSGRRRNCVGFRRCRTCTF